MEKLPEDVALVAAEMAVAVDPRERVDEAKFKLADDRVADPPALWPDLGRGHRSAVAYQVQLQSPISSQSRTSDV
jgi:hypothetical protein